MAKDETANFRRVEQPLLVEIVASELRTAIFEGRMRPNDRVSDYQIAQDMGVSRSPVREAIRRLAARGLVQETARRGAVVTTLSRADAQSIYDCRRALETLAARRVTESSPAEAGAVLEQICRRMGAVSAKGNITAVAEIDAEFHTTLCNLADNPWLDRLNGMISDQSRLIQQLNNQAHPPSNVEEMRAIHEPIVEAIASGDVKRAEAAVLAHIDDAERAFLEEAGDLLENS